MIFCGLNSFCVCFLFVMYYYHIILHIIICKQHVLHSKITILLKKFYDFKYFTILVMKNLMVCYNNVKISFNQYYILAYYNKNKQRY